MFIINDRLTKFLDDYNSYRSSGIDIYNEFGISHTFT